MAQPVSLTPLSSTQVSPAEIQKYSLPDTPVSLPSLSPVYLSASRAPETVGPGSVQNSQYHVSQVSSAPFTIVSSGEYRNNLYPGAAVSTGPPTYPMASMGYNGVSSPSLQNHQRHHPVSYQYARGTRTNNAMASGSLDYGLPQYIPPGK